MKRAVKNARRAVCSAYVSDILRVVKSETNKKKKECKTEGYRE